MALTTPVGMMMAITQSDVLLDDESSGADTPNILAESSITDTGGGVDLISILNSLGVNDTASAIDDLVKLGIVTIADSGHATYVQPLGILNAVTETKDEEALDIMALIPISETGAAVDSITEILAMMALSDSLVSEDALELLVLINFSESLVGLDEFAILGQLYFEETGELIDAQTMQVFIEMAESAIGSDGMSITAFLSIADTSQGADQIRASFREKLAKIKTVVQNKGKKVVLS